MIGISLWCPAPEPSNRLGHHSLQQWHPSKTENSSTKKFRSLICRILLTSSLIPKIAESCWYEASELTSILPRFARSDKHQCQTRVLSLVHTTAYYSYACGSWRISRFVTLVLKTLELDPVVYNPKLVWFPNGVILTRPRRHACPWTPKLKLTLTRGQRVSLTPSLHIAFAPCPSFENPTFLVFAYRIFKQKLWTYRVRLPPPIYIPPYYTEILLVLHLGHTAKSKPLTPVYRTGTFHLGRYSWHYAVWPA